MYNGGGVEGGSIGGVTEEGCIGGGVTREERNKWKGHRCCRATGVAGVVVLGIIWLVICSGGISFLGGG